MLHCYGAHRCRSAAVSSTRRSSLWAKGTPYPGKSLRERRLYPLCSLQLLRCTRHGILATAVNVEEPGPWSIVVMDVEIESQA